MWAQQHNSLSCVCRLVRGQEGLHLPNTKIYYRFQILKKTWPMRSFLTKAGYECFAKTNPGPYYHQKYGFFFSLFCIILLITGCSRHLPGRQESLGLPPFHSIISQQSPIRAHKDPGGRRWPWLTSVRVSSCAQGCLEADSEQRSCQEGEKRGW